MGKHEAPAPPVKEKVHFLVRICTHHGMHFAGVLALHVMATVSAAPILITIMGDGGSH